MERVDAIIIGCGQAGKPLALAFAKDGKRVVLFERERVGGSCVNFGCTPSKALLASAHNAGRARLAAPLGVHCDVRVDQRAVFERVRAIRDEWHASSLKSLTESTVDLVHAEARFTGTRIVSGGGREITAPLIVIDTGTSASMPPVAGLGDVPHVTNHEIFDLETLPTDLLVLGGGYIGLELGQAAQRLGSNVTIVNFGPRIMGNEEADATAVLHDALVADGVRIENCSQARVVRRTGDNEGIELVIDGGPTVHGNGLLVAAGRTPNTQALDVAASGIALTKAGYVEVDDFLETACEGVYAVGDCAGQPAFTHVSWEDHRRILATLAGTPRKRDDRVLSYTTFTEPQLARTGLTEDQAIQRGIAAKSMTLPLSDVARGEEWNLATGFFRLVIDTATDKIVGATFVGYEAGELIHVIAAHIELGATWRDLDRQMYVHPTFAEGLPSLARMFAGA
jgi:dihydrolipoamide dehydrogenase